MAHLSELPAQPPEPTGLDAAKNTEHGVDADVRQRLERLLEPLGRVRSAGLLTGGLFATTYGVRLDDGRAIVVKTAPADTARLLTYEHDLIRAEALAYEIGHSRPDLLFPRLLATDFSRTVFDGDVVVASFLPGVPWEQAGFGPVAQDPRAARAQRDLGALMARAHTVTGPRFGYLVEGSGLTATTWPDAFCLMVEALLADAARCAVELPVGEIRSAVEAHLGALVCVRTPVLVHHDLWPGNLFVDPGTGELIGVIDPERALWGDPLLDLLGADQVGTDPAPPGLLEGYARQAGAPLDVTSPSAVARLRLYRVLWSLIWIVEATPRAYEGDFATWYVSTARDNLRTSLDALLPS